MSVLTSENVAFELGPANASATAQQSGQGIGIQNIRRAVGRAVLTDESGSGTVSATSFSALPVALELTVVLSGRPIRVAIDGNAAAGTSGSLALDVTMRGEALSGAPNGMVYVGTTAVTSIHGEEIVMAPRPGRATFAVVAKRATADGAVYYDANNRFSLTVVEL